MNMHHKLNYTITHQFDGLDISDAEFRRLLDISSWNGVVPTFTRRGRGAWEQLNETVRLKANPDVTFCAAKLKGVGLWNPILPGDAEYSNKLHDDMSQDPVPPLTDLLEYLVTYPHFGISNEAEYKYAYSSPSPIGGIVHERAHREFWSSQRLVEHGVPTIAPLAVIQYDESLRFQDQPMGAVITLSPGSASYRISEILFGAALARGTDPTFDAHYDGIRASLGIEGDPDDERVRLQVVQRLARDAGKLLHDFSLCGMYRYSGDWGNFVYSVETDQLFLIDLDSVQDMGNLPPEAKAMQAWRDLVSAIYRMTAKLGYPTALDQYTLDNLLEFDPIAAKISGYFPDIPEDEIRPLSRRLWNYFIPHLFLLKKHRAAIREEWDGDRRKSYKMDHDLFYILALTTLRPLFERSEVGRMYPSKITEEDMWAKAERFLGDRYEYFCHLMRMPVA